MQPVEQAEVSATWQTSVSRWVERMVDVVVWTAVVAGAVYGFEPSALGAVRALLTAMLFGAAVLLVVGALSLLLQLVTRRSMLRPPGRAGRWLGVVPITWRRVVGTFIGLNLLHSLLAMTAGVLGRDLSVVAVNAAVALALYGLFQLVMRFRRRLPQD